MVKYQAKFGELISLGLVSYVVLACKENKNLRIQFSKMAIAFHITVSCVVKQLFLLKVYSTYCFTVCKYFF